jgi:hypothetical protein
MLKLRILLRSGDELPLGRTIYVEELIAAKPRLQKLHGMLKERFRRSGVKDADDRATLEIDALLRAAFLDLDDAFIAGKSKAITRLFELQQEVFSVYDDVLRSRKTEVKVDLKALHAKYREMQTLFDDLAKNAKQVADDAPKPNANAAANRIAVQPTAVPEGTVVAKASTRLASLNGRKGWKQLPDGTWQAKLKTGVVELREIDGVIHVTSTAKGKPPVMFKEFDTLAEAYSKKPLSTRVIQAHHGCQDALMKRLFGRHGYDGDGAPTIWLRDSTGDSPHGIITHAMQNPLLETRATTKGLSYGMIRDWAVADLKAAGASDDSIRAYLKTIDEYFKLNIEPKLAAAGKLHLKGTIKDY